MTAISLDIGGSNNVFPAVSRSNLCFVVVGAGGTGGYLVRDLSRLIGALNQKYRTKHSLVIVDGDDVEPKNIGRQNFIDKDIGKNKAYVLASRYGNAFNVDIQYVNRYLTTADTIETICDFDTNDRPKIVLVGCVDNNSTRHILHHIFRDSNSRNYTVMAYLDSGNENSAGQVVCGMSQIYSRTGESRAVVINDIVEEFGIDDDHRHPDELSCADHAVSAPQDITVNIMASNILLNYCSTFLYNASTIRYAQELNFDNAAMCITRSNLRPLVNHVVFFDSFNNNISTRPFVLSSYTKEFLTQENSTYNRMMARYAPTTLENTVTIG